jgi:RNA polymerase sigma factor (sigma-70 family)
MKADRLRELFRRAKDGDRAATDEILNLSYAYSVRLAREKADARILAKEECEDIGSSVARELVSGFAKFQFAGDAAFYSFLATAVEHKIRGKAAYWKAQRRDVRRETPIESMRRDSTDASAPGLLASDTDPADRAQRAESERIMDVEIQRLDEPQRTILQLYRQEMTDAAIGRRIGKNGDQVRYLREKAFRELRRRLDRLKTRVKGE